MHQETREILFDGLADWKLKHTNTQNHNPGLVYKLQIVQTKVKMKKLIRDLKMAMFLLQIYGSRGTITLEIASCLIPSLITSAHIVAYLFTSLICDENIYESFLQHLISMNE